jgi:hypothetical protein
MVAILNQKWPPKCKNPPIWAKFGFQHDKNQKLGSNGEHSPKFTQQVSLEYQRWLAGRFIIA